MLFNAHCKIASYYWCRNGGANLQGTAYSEMQCDMQLPHFFTYIGQKILFHPTLLGQGYSSISGLQWWNGMVEFVLQGESLLITVEPPNNGQLGARVFVHYSGSANVWTYQSVH